MTLNEARKVAEVLATVDGGCHVCYSAAADAMAEVFPEFPWLEMVETAAHWDFNGWDAQ